MAPVGKCDLSDDEKQMFASVTEGNIDDVTEKLNTAGIRVNCVDENGMTVLQHAAYKANHSLCKKLLARGADVNVNLHDHGYTTLMFAAISGSVPVTQLMLEAGANIMAENSVSRTAACMAAFVGQHQCVTLINNFFPKEDLAYYTRLNGLETQPKLSVHLLTPLYNYILMNNLHPVGLSLCLQSNAVLVECSTQVCRVLDLLCERMMKQSYTNHVLAIKFHYLGALLRQCAKTNDPGLQSWIKGLLKGRSGDGFPERQEVLIRSTLKDFPYIDNQLLQQMIRTLAPVTIGDEPTGLNLLRSSINGQKMASEDELECHTCGRLNKASSRCSVCKLATYCDQRCQKLQWFTHKKCCAKMAVRYKQIMAQKARNEEADRKLKAEDEKRKEEEGKGGGEDGGNQDKGAGIEGKTEQDSDVPSETSKMVESSDQSVTS